MLVEPIFCKVLGQIFSNMLNLLTVLYLASNIVKVAQLSKLVLPFPNNILVTFHEALMAGQVIR